MNHPAKIPGMKGTEAEVGYQGGACGKYALDSDRTHYILLNKETYCMAIEKYGLQKQKSEIKLSDLCRKQ